MIIICGRTIAEVEHDLEMAKAAIATGSPIGVGGATMADVEQALRGLHTAMGESNPPISNPNYDPCNDCPHWKPNNECEVGYECDEEIEDRCPICDATYPDWDGEYCEHCGYEEEEDEELTANNLDGLSSEEIDRITASYGLPKAWADIMKKLLGL